MARQQPILRNLLAGAMAGAVATWIMGKVTTLLYEREAEPVREHENKARRGKTSYAAAAEKLARAVGTDLSDEARDQKYGPAIHWAFGIGAGALYGALRPRLEPVGLARGLVFGAAFWLVIDEMLTPVLGLTPKPAAFPWQTHARGLAGHLVFGAVADTVLRAVDAAA